MTSRELFEKGIAFLRENNTLGALACFEKAYAIEKLPELKSYLGFCVADQRGRIAEALTLCNDAIAEEPQNAVHYLNLAKVYLKAERKVDALEILRKGISFGDNTEIRNLLENLGDRRKLLFPFLPRRHFLNKFSGLILHRIKTSIGLKT